MATVTSFAGVSHNLRIETLGANKSYKKNSYYKRVNSFLNGWQFQDLCCCHNNITVGTLFNISITEGDNIFLYDNDKMIEGVTINLKPIDGLHDYKCERMYGTPKIREYRIYFSGNYLVDYQDGRWVAIPLLVSAYSFGHKVADECLQINKIGQAFADWAGSEECELEEMPKWCEGTLFPGTKQAFKTQFAAQKAVEADGTESVFICIADNGKLLKLAAADVEYTPVALVENKIWKTNFNWFVPNGLGDLYRKN